jgi:hypothetical protein
MSLPLFFSQLPSNPSSPWFLSFRQSWFSFFAKCSDLQRCLESTWKETLAGLRCCLPPISYCKGACLTAPTFPSPSPVIALFPSPFLSTLFTFPSAAFIAISMCQTVPTANSIRFASLHHANGTTLTVTPPHALSLCECTTQDNSSKIYRICM